MLVYVVDNGALYTDHALYFVRGTEADRKVVLAAIEVGRTEAAGRTIEDHAWKKSGLVAVLEEVEWLGIEPMVLTQFCRMMVSGVYGEADWRVLESEVGKEVLETVVQFGGATPSR